MATVLIVDDNAIDRRLAGGIVEKVGMATQFAKHGKEALEHISREPPDIVLTDMLMPEMDGLELVERIRQDYSHIPVILMTAHGSEEIAVKALRTGAASYVPKQLLARELAGTIHDMLSVVTTRKDEQKAIELLEEVRMKFVLGADLVTHEPVVGYLQDQLRKWHLCEGADLIRVGTALHEAFVNAIEHGNLELDSEMRDDPHGSYQLVGEQRRKTPPWCDRKVHVWAQLTHTEATISIRDQGPGFDPKSLPDPTDPENIGKISGRGLLLIRTFMDDIRFNDTGNEITLVKRKPT